MLNYLLDVSSNTPVAMLPEIVTHNNDAIRNEFDNIYDPEKDRLIRSVYTPTGSVTAYNGVFTNVTIDNLILRSNDALSDVIKDTIQFVPHAIMTQRFSSDTLDKAYSKSLNDTNSRIAHDAGAIVVPSFKYYQYVEGTSGEILMLQDVLTDLYAKYLALASKVSGNTAIDMAGISTVSAQSASVMSINSDATSVQSKARSVSSRDNAYPWDSSEPITYPANYVYATIPQLRRNGLPKLHISDLLAGNVYTYYNANAALITVNNTNPIDIESQNEGSVYTLCLSQSVKDKTEFKILLERSENSRKYLLVNAMTPELTRIQLQCKTAYAETVGTVWEIFGYSLPGPDTTLEIITEN